MRITVEQYFGPYLDEASKEHWAAAHELLEKVDHLLDLAEQCGVVLVKNPATNSLISGSKNGGFRPQDCPIGAPKSKHKTAHAVDVFDPMDELDAWLASQPEEVLEDYGLWFEAAKATKSWSHMQDIPPPSKRRFFFP